MGKKFDFAPRLIPFTCLGSAWLATCAARSATWRSDPAPPTLPSSATKELSFLQAFAGLTQVKLQYIPMVL